MSARRFDLLVFDWDGTLFDSTVFIAKAIQAAVRDVGGQEPTLQQAQYVIGMGLMQALAHAAPDVPEALVPQLAQRYRHHYMAQQRQIHLFDGVLNLLHTLKRRGYALAVATGKSRRGLDEALDHVDLQGMFDATRTADQTASKPDPLMLHELMQELGVPPHKTLMVGDTTHDLLLAHNAQCASVAVSYGAHDRKMLLQHSPLAVLDGVPDLQAWMDLHA